ncbi:hypothetical protein QBC37DRAFT_432676 [Rhypophila decipiens]|uniref:DUF7707 domain-containing protein n=1 Tax=Rhypophila decipiens TaxID=261697 RepID=A0AAN6XWM5_9PEZI|nr:hypothetical protein QBC37DRAFT_432676 [Rhypophila decipiens]
MAGLRTWLLPIGNLIPNLLFGLFLFSSPLCSAKTFEIDPKTVDLGTREMWCAMEIQTCSLICDTQMSKKDNYCNATTLEYRCRCKTWQPQMDRYEHTLPTFLCTKTYDNCVKSNFGDLGAQNSCTVSIKRFCGDLTPVPGGGGAGGASDVFENQSQQPTKAPSDTKSTTNPAATASNANAKASPSPPDPLKANKEATSSPSSRNSTSTDEDDDEDTDGNPGRDTGAKAGMAGGAVAALALVICVIYIYRLRKKAALSHTLTQSTEARELSQAENGLKASHSKDAAELGGMVHRKPELDGEALEDGSKEWAVEMEQPGAVRGVPAAVHELEVYSPVELDATGDTFELVGSIKKKEG